LPLKDWFGNLQVFNLSVVKANVIPFSDNFKFVELDSTAINQKNSLA
jgi:hypothetical protein